MAFDSRKHEREHEGTEAAELAFVELPTRPRRDPQRPLDDFEIRRLPGGDMEVVFCGSRYDDASQEN